MDTRLVWASSGFTSTNIPGTDTAIGTGRQNTALILSVDANAPAAKACADYRGGGEDDWFLPSKDELDLMYRNLKANNFGGFQGSYFWSSSQDNNYNHLAWGQNSDNGNQGTNYKFSGSVRAVRAF